MDKKEYIEKLTEQMRCERARELVAKEYEQHIDDQTEAFQSEGVEEAEARLLAVTEMGDPVEVGVEMDRLHRPQMEWKMLLLIGVLSIAGLLLPSVLNQVDLVPILPRISRFQLVYTVLGFGMMLLVYRLDYSFLGKWWGKLLSCGIILLGVLMLVIGTSVNGSFQYLTVLGRSIHITPLFYLYAPLYGSVLYSYRGQGKRGVLTLSKQEFPFLLGGGMNCN